MSPLRIRTRAASLESRGRERIAFAPRSLALLQAAAFLLAPGLLAQVKLPPLRWDDPKPAISAESKPASRPAAALALGSVGGQPIDVRELLGGWLHADSRQLGEYLDKLVNQRLVRLEAARLGVSATAEQIELRYADARLRMEELVRRDGSDLALDTYVRRELGLDPARYFERMRAECQDQLLAERVVRTHLLSSERAELRVIVVADEARAAEVRAALAAGTSFEEAARRFSIDGSRERGGRIAPVIRSPRSPLSELAFRTPAGQVGGPLPQAGRLLLLRVDSIEPPLAGRWPELGARVLESLEARPIEEPEFWQWRAEMERRYEIDLSPLLELVGEPPPKPSGS